MAGELKRYKLYDYMLDIELLDTAIPPYEQNYNILGLHKKTTLLRGELIKTEYYGIRNFVTDEWDELCVVEEREFFRQGGFVYLRNMDISFIHVDGTTGETITTQKYYTLPQAIDEGIRRRNNIISQLKIDVIGIIAQTQELNMLIAEDMAKEILREIEYELSLYIDGDILPIINKFFDMELDVLDDEIPNTGGLTLRDYIIYGLIT